MNMNYLKKLRACVTSDKATYLPLILLTGLAAIVVSSYLLAGWMMHPIGDDYNSLLAYHINNSWISTLPHTVITGGGRYSQTFVAVVLYGEFGQKSLKLTAFLSVGLFLLAGYLAVLAWQKSRGKDHNHKLALGGASVLFLLYTLFSVTFPWIRGTVDNTFQDLLWLPGFITYTLPFTLLAILVSVAVIAKPRSKRTLTWLLPLLGLAGIFCGMFTEVIPITFTEFLGVIALYKLVRVRFAWAGIKKIIRTGLPYVIINAGLLVGLLLNFMSKATSQRRAGLNESATTHDLLTHSVTATKNYLSTYIFGSTAGDHVAMLLAVVAGIAIGLFALSRFGFIKIWRSVIGSALLAVFFFVMSISSIFICFFEAYKGYGLTSYTYLVPRFEITYNVWLCLAFIFVGITAAAAARALLTNKQFAMIMPIVCLVATLFIMLDVPHIFTQASSRLRTVAVFSSAWEAQNTELKQDANSHVHTAVVPVIDIGDAFNINCHDKSGNDWLGLAKEQFYHVSEICSQP
jgi:hypothetical protein